MASFLCPPVLHSEPLLFECFKLEFLLKLFLLVLKQVFLVCEFLPAPDEFRHGESVDTCVRDSLLQITLGQSCVVTTTIPHCLTSSCPCSHASQLAEFAAVSALELWLLAFNLLLIFVCSKSHDFCLVPESVSECFAVYARIFFHLSIVDSCF
jgi:hypothetical protein